MNKDWDINCPQETKNAIAISINSHLEEIVDMIKRDTRQDGMNEPDHRIIKGLQEYFK